MSTVNSSSEGVGFEMGISTETTLRSGALMSSFDSHGGGSTRSGRRGRSQRNGGGSGVTRGVEISNGGSSANLPTAGSWAGAAGLDAASSLPGADAAARENRTMRL